MASASNTHSDTGTARANVMPRDRMIAGEQANYSSLHAASAMPLPHQAGNKTNKQSQWVKQCMVPDGQQTNKQMHRQTAS